MRHSIVNLALLSHFLPPPPPPPSPLPQSLPGRLCRAPRGERLRLGHGDSAQDRVPHSPRREIQVPHSGNSASLLRQTVSFLAIYI